MTTRGNAEYQCAVDGCAQPTHERRICHTCAGQLTRDLATMPDLLDDLAITLSRQARIGGHTNGSASRERPLPYDPRASEAGYVLRSTLAGWVRELHNQVEYRPTDSTYATALWLHMRNTRLLNHPNAHEAVDEIGAAVKHTKQAIDRPAPRVYAGRCLVEDCDGELYATPYAVDVDCPTCGIAHPVAERRQAMLDDLDGMLLTAAEAAHLATYLIGDRNRSREQVRKLINQWHKRGQLAARTHEPRFNFGEIKALLDSKPHEPTRASVTTNVSG